MTTLTTGGTATFSIDAFGYIDINAPTNTVGTVRFASAATNLRSSTTETVMRRRFGPYGVPGTVTITCTEGTLEYTYTEGYAPTSTGDSTHLGTITAATMLATPGAQTGWTCRVSDLGNTSPWFEYDGTNWIPLGRRQLAFRLVADTDSLSLTTSAQVISGCSCTIPAGVLNFSGAGLHVMACTEKSAGTDNATYQLLFGANNTSADASLGNPSNTDRGHVMNVGYRRTSATALIPLGKGISSIANRLDGGSTNGARPSAVTVSTLASANYLGLYASAAGTPTETVLANVFDVYVIG